MKGLCLTGGGSKGAWQAGAVLALSEHVKARAIKKYGRGYRTIQNAFDWDYARLSGVSVGAINVAKLGQYRIGYLDRGANELVRLWRKLDDKDVKRGSETWGAIRFALGWQDSVWDQVPYLGKLIEREMNMRYLRISSRRTMVGAVSLSTGKYELFDQNREDFVDCVLASSSFPILFRPIEIDGQLYSDGGLRNMAPLASLMRENCDHITVIGVTDPEWDEEPWKPDGSLSYVSRSIGIMTSELARTDYQVTGLKNDLADVSSSYRNVWIDLFVPARPLNERDTLVFDNKTNRLWVDEGYETIKAILDRRDAEEEVYGEP